ncbi:MAG: UDP-N-acetylmuramate dehydrogenase [Eggerthellaceae bacterium]|jgi:UDP-N-acetylmuramate dehydrogenase
MSTVSTHGPSPLFAYGPGFKGSVRRDEPMSRHTTYHIGGPASYFIEVEDLAALARVMEDCARFELPWALVGQGSNLLVSDDGFDGVVIVLKGQFRTWTFDAEHMRYVVGAGMMLSRMVQEAYHEGLSGLEFAVGTPGTIGGALRMNAGTGTQWIGQRVVSVTTYRVNGGLLRRDGTDITWGYRFSSIPADEIVVECELAMERGAEVLIRNRMDGALSRRKKSQPMGMPSCGSVFRNPEGKSAGRLIEQLGLKGTSVGGAQISTVHANFIVNKGGASALDVLKLMHLAQDKVKEAYGIELQPEVRFLGFA